MAKGINTRQLADIKTRFRDAVHATGAFGIEQIKTKSATERFTESLQRQDITFGRAIKSRKMFNNVLAEQYRIQKMLAVQWTTSASGRMTADMVMPKGLDPSLQKINESFRQNAKVMATSKRGSMAFTQASEMMRMRLGLLNQVVASGADNMLKWGKNTQWAGRQLMVGFTVPFAAFGVLAAKVAFDVDKQLTRISKVYDTEAKTSMGRQREINNLRERSTNNAIQVAKRYGSAIQETLEVEAELAATGLRGRDLIQSTSEVQRIATLGELDRMEATKMSIALQTAFNLTTDETSKKMNFMNAIENATSLSLKDFAEATPRAASAMASLGVSVEEMGILLVAMKENGVDAAQGANALRSATARLIRPTKESVAVLGEMGVDLEAITNASGGNLFKALEMIGGEFKRLGLNALQQRQAVAELFGTYQFNRLNAALIGVTNKTGQVGRAIKVTEQTTEQWAATAQREIGQMTNSLSGRFTRAVQGARAELVRMGQPFLEFGVFMLSKVIAPMLSWFNGLPKGAKVAAASILGLLAVMGPIVMLAGLLGNGLGQLIKFGAVLGGMATKFRAITASQQAESLLAAETTKMWQNQGQAARMLAAEITGLTTALQRQAGAAKTAMVSQSIVTPMGTTVGSGYVPGASGLLVPVNTAQGKQAVADATEIENKAKGTAAAAEKTGKSWGKMAAGAGTVGMVASGLAIASGKGGELTSHILNGLFAASLIGPALVKGLTSGALVGALTRLKATFALAYAGALGSGASQVGAVGSGFMSAAGGVKMFSMSLLRLAGPIGILATGAYALFKINGELKKATEQQKELNNSAEGWADILGFVAVEGGRMNIPGGDKSNGLSAMQEAAKELTEKYPLLIEDIREATTQQEKMNIAIAEGWKVFNAGGSEQNAFDAIRTALLAATNDPKLTKGLMVKIQAEIEFTNIDQAVQNLSNQMNRIIKDDYKMNLWQKMGDVFSGPGLSNRAEEAAKGVAKSFYETLSAESKAGKTNLLEGFDDELSNRGTSIFNKMRKGNEEKFKSNGISSLSDVQRAIQSGNQSDTGLGSLGDDGRLIQDMNNYYKGIESISQALMRRANAADKDVKATKDLGDVIEYLARKNQIATMSTKEAQEGYRNALKSVSQTGKELNDVERLAILNSFRRASGQKAATSVEQGFGADVAGVESALEGQAGAMENSRNFTKKWAASQVEAQKTAMTSAWNSTLDSAMDQYNTQYEGQLESLDGQAEAISEKYDAKQDRFQSRWDKIYKREDRMWNNRIKKENDAENNRKKMFAAEEARLNRLNELANGNIDFNREMNLGNYDEAAKISNNLQTLQENWANQDADEAAGSGTEKRVAKLEKQRDKEKVALDERKKAAEDALAAERKLEEKRLDDRRKSIEKFHELNVKSLERELEVLRNQTPKTEAAMRARMEKVKAIYEDHGVYLNTSSQEWGESMADNIRTAHAAAQASLKNDMKWEQIGKDAANKVTQGAFGMTKDEFMTWIRTGDMPEVKKGNQAGTNGKLAQGKVDQLTRKVLLSQHEGGIIGSSGGSRRGYSGGQMPGETTINALKGEAVINRRATRMLGKSGIDSINSGDAIGGGLGLAGLMGAGVVGAMRSAINAGVVSAGIRKVRELAGMNDAAYGVAQAGKFGDVSFGADQLAHAATIMNVGREKGATSRDIQIALMTAMQESMLRNVQYGDRDSLGLFQQRPSQGWGSPEQVTNPEYAAGKFFDSLLKIGNRGSMSMTQAAQAVQRSAYPDAYAKWENEAAAIMQGSPMDQVKGGAWVSPLSQIRYSRSWDSHPDPKGADLGARVRGVDGDPVYSVGGGRVVTSTDLRDANGNFESYGRYIVVQHGDNARTLYAHLSRAGVKAGDAVSAGQMIGNMGNTGNSSGTHLHFESWAGGRNINPKAFGIPGMRVGGNIRYDNTIANLHKGEKVLTSPLSSALERGITNIDRGSNSEYNVSMNFYGDVKSEVDVERAVEKVLTKITSRNGRNRRIS